MSEQFALKMEPNLILFTGLPGTGKTTLARRLCRVRSLPLVSFDHFVDYSWPNRLLDVEVLTDDELWTILFSTAALQLSNGLSTVMDAVFGARSRGGAAALADSCGAGIRTIHTFCSDERIWKARVMQRFDTASTEETPARWEQVLDDQGQYQAPAPEEALYCDAVRPVEENLARVLAYLDSGRAV